jgi:uncharacterized protein (TIGR02145 family)
MKNFVRMVMLSAVAVAMSVGTVSAQQKGTFTDSRDGKKYKTVKIDGKTYMAENLNYQTESGSWCYNDSISYCKKYGRLYDFETAKVACPKGWFLPTPNEWPSVGVSGRRYSGEPINSGGKELKSKSGWNDQKNGRNGNGADEKGFSALPGGWRDKEGKFGGVGDDGTWWVDWPWGDKANNESMWNESDELSGSKFDKRYGFSVRCFTDK